MVQFANDIIAVDERCGGGGGIVHTSKFTSIMMLKIVVCIGSDCAENVFRLVGLGCKRGPGDVDVHLDGGVWALVARCGIRRDQYVKGSCRGVRAEMEQWFDCHGRGWVYVSSLCKNRI